MIPRNFFVVRAVVFIVIIAIIGIVAGFKYLGDTAMDASPSFSNDAISSSSGSDGQNMPHRGELDSGGEADPARMTLEMRNPNDPNGKSQSWTWIMARSADGKEIRPAIGDEKKFSITFSPRPAEIGSFIGTTDCNSMQGKFAADHKIERDASGDVEPRAIKFTEVFRTEMACGDSQEAEFAALIENAASYEFTVRGELILNQKGGGMATFR